jgi:hypothetical protein
MFKAVIAKLFLLVYFLFPLARTCSPCVKAQAISLRQLIEQRSNS